MKVVDLARIAASAEVLRLRRKALRIGRQAGFLVGAGLFGFFALIFAHVLLWMVCYGPWHTGKVWASVIVVAVDLLLAVLLGLLGRGRLADPIEVEARITRDRSLAEMRSAAAMTAVTAAVTGPAGRLAGRTVWAGIRRILPGRRRSR